MNRYDPRGMRRHYWEPARTPAWVELGRAKLKAQRRIRAIYRMSLPLAARVRLVRFDRELNNLRYRVIPRLRRRAQRILGLRYGRR